MRKGVLVFGIAALASVLANAAILAPVNATDITSADGATKTLSGTIDDGIYVKSGANITITLDNATINAAAGKDTVYVEKGAKLTLTGKGTINNVAGYAGVFNNGEAAIDGDITINHTGSYYAVLNHGEMIINKATIKADKNTNSVVVNGYYDYGDTSSHRVGYVKDVAYANPKMTLGSDVVVDAPDAKNVTIKNDDGGIMTINGGTYIASAAGAFQNAHKATVNGGTFTQTNVKKPLLYNVYYAGGNDEGILEINDGLFNYAEDTFVEAKDGGKITIKGGTFSFAPEEEYIADGVKFEKNDNNLWAVKAPIELPADSEEEEEKEEKNPATADNLFASVAIFAGALVAFGATLVASKRA